MLIDATDIEGHRRARTAWVAEAREHLNRIERGDAHLIDARLSSERAGEFELILRFRSK